MLKSKPAGFILVMFLAAHILSAQPISFDISWEHPERHYFQVEMTVPTHGEPSTDVRIAAWRPGRYILQEFSKNIVSVSAVDANGNHRTLRKTDKSTWHIESEGTTHIVVRYLAYAHEMDAGNSYVDDSEAYLNPVTMMMYVPGRELEPVSVRLNKPADWQVATALDADADGSFPASSFHELADSPILVSPHFETLIFDEGGARFEIVLQGDVAFDGDQIVTDVQSIVHELASSMDVVPFKRFVFLYHLRPNRQGHGVEHRNSTSIVIGPADFSNPGFYRGAFLGVTAHEFFHAWNVERIRPAAMYYPDYSVENYTTTMWIYEGITSYYSMMVFPRTGLSSFDNFPNRLSGLFQFYDQNYGRAVTSVAMSSWDSWTKSSNAPPNTFYSFYTAGNVLGALLDLEVMHRTGAQKSLDDVFQYLYQTYASKDIGVPEDGFESALAEVTGTSFDQFFADYVYGTRAIDYNEFLQHAGLRLVKEAVETRPASRLGLRAVASDDGFEIRSIVPDSPAYEAGFDIDDVVLAVDGVKPEGSLSSALSDYNPGDTLTFTVQRRMQEKTLSVTLADGGNIVYKVEELPEASAEQMAVRNLWYKARGAE